MGNIVVPQKDAFCLGPPVTREYPFKLKPTQIDTIVQLAVLAPDFVKVAADYWSNWLSGKAADVWLKDFLTKLTVSAFPTFQATGGCKAVDEIEIEWYDPGASRAEVPGLKIEGKPLPLKATTIDCQCSPKEDPPTGKKRERIFIIKWWVNIAMKTVVVDFLGQLDEITVTAPCGCCCDGKLVTVTVKPEAPPKKAETLPKKAEAPPKKPEVPPKKIIDGPKKGQSDGPKKGN